VVYDDGVEVVSIVTDHVSSPSCIIPVIITKSHNRRHGYLELVNGRQTVVKHLPMT